MLDSHEKTWWVQYPSIQDREKVRSSSSGKVDTSTDLFNELVSIKEALRDAVPCPHCRIAISRVSGCNHMRCRNCGNGFCYDCGEPLDYHRMYCTLFWIYCGISNIFIVPLHWNNAPRLKVTNAGLMRYRNQWGRLMSWSRYRKK